MVRPSLAIIAIVFSIGASPAGERTPTAGNSIWSGCNANPFSQTYFEQYAACRAYIIAIADGLSGSGRVAGVTACIPAKASKADITGSVIGWLKGNRGRRTDTDAHRLVAEALASAYPCK